MLVKSFEKFLNENFNKSEITFDSDIVEDIKEYLVPNVLDSITSFRYKPNLTDPLVFRLTIISDNMYNTVNLDISTRERDPGVLVISNGFGHISIEKRHGYRFVVEGIANFINKILDELFK